jgi:hypothetical protein
MIVTTASKDFARTVCLCVAFVGMTVQADDLSFALWDTGAFVTISGSGRVDVQFGSTVGDHAFLPPGSVDLELVRALLPDPSTLNEDVGPVIAVGGERGQRSLERGAVLIYALCSKYNDWRLDPMGDPPRVRKMLEENVTSRCERISQRD